MTRTHAAAPAATEDRAPARSAVGSSATHAEHAADRFAAHATTGRAADWSFGQVPVHSEVGAAPGAARLAEKLTGPGRSVDTATARTLGGGQDLSDVRLHTGPEAATIARDARADAVTIGRDIAFADGRFDDTTQRGRHLLAHELAHAVQHGDNPLAMHRKEVGERTSAPAQGDYEMFVDEAINYLNSAVDHYRSMAQVANATQSSKGGAAQQAPSAKPAGLPTDRLPEALRKLQETYDSSREIVEQQLNGEAARTQRLRRSYVDAAAAARSAVVGMPRANLIIISAPKETGKEDWFINNATTYARLYYGKPRDGSVVSTTTGVDSIDALFDAIEAAEPTRLIGRVDIFCHGTIEPVHQLRLGTAWHRTGEFQSAAATRAGKSATLATQSRFDGSSLIELHACRLGAPNALLGNSAEAPTTGPEFLASLGTAIGGEQGQSVTGYVQKWAPSAYGTGYGEGKTAQMNKRTRAAFDQTAVALFDAAMAGSTEVQNLLTESEAKSGVVTRERKIAIMADLSDQGGGKWFMGQQYPSGDRPPKTKNLVTDVKSPVNTFSSEKDWQSLTLTVNVPKASGGTP
jgi:Domain of unknown function (DUF4157)